MREEEEEEEREEEEKAGSAAWDHLMRPAGVNNAENLCRRRRRPLDPRKPTIGLRASLKWRTPTKSFRETSLTART